MAVVIDTAGIDPGDRAEAVRTSMVRATAPHDVRLLGPPEQVHARIEYWPLGPDVTVLHHASSGIAHTRDERHTHHEGPERVVFVLHEGGPGSYEFADRTWELRPGSVYATALNARYSYARPGHGTARIVQVERAVLGLPIEAVQAAAGRLVTSPLYTLVRSHLRAVCADAGPASATDQAGTVGAATAALARALLVTSVDPQTHTGREALHQYMLDRLKLFIRSNLENPDLSPKMVAAVHNVSLRHVYALWRDEPLPLVATIIRLRLEAAQQRLLLHADESVSAVAYRCGFTDAAHFSRRFRQAFGLTPTEWRHLDTQQTGD